MTAKCRQPVKSPLASGDNSFEDFENDVSINSRTRYPYANETMDLRPIAHWVSRRLDQGIEHEQRVVRIASTLFDLTADLHQLNAGDRNLLRAAALVHDV